MASATILFTADTFIDSSAATTNFNGNDLDVGERNGGAELRRSLLLPNLPGVLAGSRINSVTLRVYDLGTDLSDNNRTMRVYRMLRAWSETQATWNVYSTGNNWGTAGAANTTTDREATDIGSVVLPATEVTGYVEITLTTASLQTIIDGSFTNNGYLLQMDTETNDMHRFGSKDNANPPQLVVDYTPGGGMLLTTDL